VATVSSWQSDRRFRRGQLRVAMTKTPFEKNGLIQEGCKKTSEENAKDFDKDT